MRSTLKGSMLGLALLTVGAAGAGAQTNLVSNPGFESGLTGWGLYASPGCTTLGVTPVAGTTTADAHSGTTAGVVTSNGCYAFVNQNVTMIPGHDYATSFWVKVTGTPTVGDPATVQLFSGQGTSFTGPTAAWFQIATTITATSTTGVVGVGGEWDGGDILIDDVSVTDVTTTPEPASLALLGTGIVGLAPFARRKLRR